LKSLFKVFTTPKFQKIREREKVLLEEINSKVTIEGISSTYFEESRGNGPYVLLLHGWEGNAGNMLPFVNPLIEEGFNVVIPNAPAHYTSSGENCTLRDYQKIVIEYIKRFDVKVIISHSFGSAAGLLALQDINKKQIRKIISISAPNKLIDVISDFTSLFKLSLNQKKAFNKYVENTLNLPFQEAVLSDILSKLEIETLVIHDKNDRVMSVDNAYRIANSHKGNQLFLTENLGHYRILWDTNILDKAMSFITDKVNYNFDDSSEVFSL